MIVLNWWCPTQQQHCPSAKLQSSFVTISMLAAIDIFCMHVQLSRHDKLTKVDRFTKGSLGEIVPGCHPHKYPVNQCSFNTSKVETEWQCFLQERYVPYRTIKRIICMCQLGSHFIYRMFSHFLLSVFHDTLGKCLNCGHCAFNAACARTCFTKSE